jgi:kinesin family member 1
MEKLQDLLVDKSKKGKKDLEIRSIAGKVTIPDAESVPVSNYKQIQDLMDKGDKNRTVGKTQMNATSSRAHTVVTITLKKIT